MSEKSTSCNSWREPDDSHIKEIPIKRTLGCQTGAELSECFLNPVNLLRQHQQQLQNNSPVNSGRVPRIIEKNCCQTDSCQLKNITIKLPKRP